MQIRCDLGSHAYLKIPYTIISKKIQQIRWSNQLSNVRHGMIVREQSGFYWVEVPSEANKVYRCRLRGKLMEVAHTADIAAIGDQVQHRRHEHAD